jgi:hypothetical protein
MTPPNVGNLDALPRVELRVASDTAPGLLDRDRHRPRSGWLLGRTDSVTSVPGITTSAETASLPGAGSSLQGAIFSVVPLGRSEVGESEWVLETPHVGVATGTAGAGTYLISSKSIGLTVASDSFRSFAWNPIHSLVPDSAAAVLESRQMAEHLQKIFENTSRERYEPGMQSLFSRELLGLIERHGEAAVADAVNLIYSPLTTPSVAAEALVWLGQSEHKPTHTRRRLAIEAGLMHLIPRIREAAIIGLDSLADPESIPAILAAIDREPVASLRQDMKQIIDQLRKV